MDTRKKTEWIERIEELVRVLEGSTISELELTEGDTEIVIRRSPGMVMASVPAQQRSVRQAVAPRGNADGAGRTKRSDQGVAVTSPMTGVYYSAASPTSPPFVSIGDIVHVGQVIALVEAMKVFNEVQADVSGRVVAIVAKSGDVVQKGEALLRVEP